jgi:hypothetical protein
MKGYILQRFDNFIDHQKICPEIEEELREIIQVLLLEACLNSCKYKNSKRQMRAVNPSNLRLANPAPALYQEQQVADG